MVMYICNFRFKMMASMDAEAEMENLFAEDEAQDEGDQGTQSLTQEEGICKTRNHYFINQIYIL